MILRTLLFLTIFMTSTLAFAEGYLTLKQPVFRSVLGNNFNYYPYQNNYNPDISIFISEPLGKNWTFLSWNGYVSGNTFIFDEGVAYNVNPSFRLGIGVNYSDGRIDDAYMGTQRYQNLEGKVWGEVKLW